MQIMCPTSWNNHLLMSLVLPVGLSGYSLFRSDLKDAHQMLDENRIGHCFSKDRESLHNWNLVWFNPLLTGLVQI